MLGPVLKLRSRALLLLAWTAFAPGCAPSRETPDRAAGGEPLNIVLVVVDDLNTHIGAYGNTRIETPFIDALAARGVRFDHAYAQFPLCVPSRHSLFSGRYPNVNAPTTNRDDIPRFAGLPFLPEFFREHGYLTFGTGKTGPAANLSPTDQLPTESTGEAPAPAETGAWDDEENEEAVEETPSSEEASHGGSVVRFISHWIEESGERPFFASVGLEAPHLPFKAPADIRSRYPPYTIEIAAEPPGHLDSVPDIAMVETEPSLMNREWREGGIDDLRRRQLIGDYYACVTFADRQVGALMATLDRLDLWRRTVVVLVSDHGFHLGEHGLWRKMSLFEESVRVPLIVVAPGMTPGTHSERTVELVDLYPTLVELAGFEPPANLQGLSLVSLLRDPEAKRDRAAFTVVHREAGRMGRSLRSERYRYIEWEGEPRVQLYDHRNDPHEYVNLATDPSRQSVVEKYAKLLKKRTRLAARKRPGKGNRGKGGAASGKAAKKTAAPPG